MFQREKKKKKKKVHGWSVALGLLHRPCDTESYLPDQMYKIINNPDSHGIYRNENGPIHNVPLKFHDTNGGSISDH